VQVQFCTSRRACAFGGEIHIYDCFVNKKMPLSPNKKKLLGKDTTAQALTKRRRARETSLVEKQA
jgi:hypothetical protein